MNKTSIGLIIATVLLLGGGLYYFLRDVPEPPSESEYTANPGQADEIVFMDGSFSQVRDGRTQWEIKAEQAQTDAEQKVVNLKNLQARIYPEGIQGEIQLTAKQGQMDTTNKVITVWDDIKAVSDHGGKFAGNMAQWFTQERRFTAEGNVQYEERGVTISGERLEADDNFTRIRVNGNAQAVLRRER